MTTHVRVPHVIDVHVPWRPPHHPPCEKPLLDEVDLSSPLRTGYMFKEAHSHVVFHKRFFVLFPRVLVYYEKESDYKKDLAKGSLEHRHRAIGLDGAYLSKPEKKVKGAKFCFILHAPDKRNERHDILLVTENKEDRKTWIDALQDQNPELLDPKHHTHRIQADTPQGSRRGSAVQPESSLQRERQSSLVTTSIRSMADPDDQSSYSNRPGSPRHSIHRLESDSSTTSGSGSMDYLDIQHLNIREGPSDTEDGPTNI